MLARKYECSTTLSSHTGSITALLFSPDGEYLASGSETGIILITATESWRTVKKLVNVAPVTALLWDPTFPMTIVCGFASGAMVTVHIGNDDSDGSGYKFWADTFDGPIYCISADKHGGTLAIGHGSGVSVLEQRMLSHWENIRRLPNPPEFTTGLPTPSPRVLYFTKDGRLIVTYLDHGLVCWDVSSMSVLWNIAPRSCSIGSSAVLPEEKHVVTSNLFDGLDFYSIADCVLSHSVAHPINQQNNAPVPVKFNSDGSAVIVGGTSGSVRVLDSSSYETLQVLSHDGDLIQAIDLYTAQDGTQIIAAGVSDRDSETTIKVWTSDPAPAPRLSPPRSRTPRPRNREPQPLAPGRPLMFSVFIGLLSLCFFFAIAHGDLWVHRWRGFLAQLLKHYEMNV